MARSAQRPAPARPAPTSTAAPLLGRSRVVAALKLIFPLTALGLMSMIFLLADPVDPSRAIEMAEIDVEDRARDPRLSAARFAGVTADGAALRIEAGAARSDPGAVLRFQVEDFALWLDRPAQHGNQAQAGHGAARLTVRAEHGEIDRNAGSFRMAGGVRIMATPGYDLSASQLSGALDRTEIEALGPIVGMAPAGSLEAGRLRIIAAPDAPEEIGAVQRLVFDGGVRLLYRPQDQGAPDAPAQP